MENDGAVLTVAGTGSGIAEDDQPHLFQRFFRADKSRARAGSHCGLGLDICKAIVDVDGGTITVSSEPGAGTVFAVRLTRPG